MHQCPGCGKRILDRNKICNRDFVRVGYERRIVVNPGNFKKGLVSPNNGRTLESWVGEWKAKDIKAETGPEFLPYIRRMERLNAEV